MTPIERAARAAMLHIVDEGGMPFEPGDAVPPAAYEIARAVLAALREPSEAIDDAMRTEGFAQGWGDSPNWEAAWRAGIEAALEEEGEEIDPRHAAHPTDTAMRPGVKIPKGPITWGSKG